MRFQVLYCLYLHEAKLTGEVECLINKLPKPGPKRLLWVLPSLLDLWVGKVNHINYYDTIILFKSING